MTSLRLVSPVMKETSPEPRTEHGGTTATPVCVVEMQRTVPENVRLTEPLPLNHCACSLRLPHAFGTPHAVHSGIMRPLHSILLALLVLILVQGCATGGGVRRAGGSRLSEAASEAKKKPEDKRKVLYAGDVIEEEEVPAWFEVSVDVAPSPEAVATEETYEMPEPPLNPSIYDVFHLGAVAGFGMPASNDFGGYSLAGPQVGFFPFERTRFDAAFLRGGTNFSQASGLNQSFRREYELAVDVSGRYYLTPEHTSVGVYPVAGVQAGVLNWDYASPVLIDDYGLSSVTSDHMLYVSPYVGLGTSLVQTRHFHFGIQLVGGMRIYDTHTVEGLQNDLFKDEAFLQLRFEMTAPF
jgi:hypothetical protein